MKQDTPKNILFFYSELAGYFLSCAETLALQYGYKVHIVHWPINPEAPFSFREYEGVKLYPKENYSREDLFGLFQALAPSLVFTIGWMDPDYKALAKQIRQSGTQVVAGLDNHWRGDLRQQVARWISPFYIKPFFDYLWVPGDPQYLFAKKLGYQEKHILRGFYSADVQVFQDAYERFKEEKEKKYPHSFLYVGRFVEVKGVLELTKAFEELKEEINHDWTLNLVGSGPLKNQIKESESVKVRDFVQADELPELAKDNGCFILPSLFEPWGVVLHEFAGAGLPLISSQNCGSSTQFIKDKENGYLFQDPGISEIKEVLRKVIESSDEQLLTMAERSYQLSNVITPQTWSETLLSIVD